MMATIDQWLGRITMYRLVLYGLCALAFVSSLLMLTGTIEYSPIAFVISLSVIVAVSYGSNRLFGWLFGIHPHAESALITGLILSLLFTPGESVLDLIKLALVATISMASKYVLAPRGRHVFNPAAIAIVIASVSGLAYATWWVATPTLIPATLIVGALILYRTNKHYVALAFVIAAIVFLAIRGTDPVTALGSWPLLFVGAIMLSEPLTLPPRAWQQYTVAFVVALLMTTPVHFGRLTMTPALALVAGNIIGWWFGTRGAIKLRFIGKKRMGETTYDFMFDTKKLSFTPGQYLELSLPHPKSDSRGQRRIFSVVGAPHTEQVNIGTKIPAKPSSFKRALMNMKLGDTLYATRIAGDFILPDDPNAPVVCIAGGIGVTPFVSYCLSSDRSLELIYAVNHAADLSYVDQLRQRDVNVTVVAPEDVDMPDADWKFVRGKLSKETLEPLLLRMKQPHVYISGPPSMVMNIKGIVRSLGVKNIKVDEFSGY